MKKRRVFWGMLFLMGAVFVVFNQVVGFASIGLWSVLWTIILIGMLVDSAIKLQFTGMFFSLAFLGIIYAEPLHLTESGLGVWTMLGAALLASIGCGMLFPKKKKYHNIKDEDYVEVINTPDSESVSISTSFGGSVKYVNTDNFKKADIHVSFAGVKVYFDNAVIQDGRAVIQMDVSFGGIELFIPRTWKIINEMDMTFGGVEEKNRNEADGSIQVMLTGEGKFAGVTVIYV